MGPPMTEMLMRRQVSLHSCHSKLQTTEMPLPLKKPLITAQRTKYT